MGEHFSPLSRRRFLQLSGAGALTLGSAGLILPHSARANTPTQGGHLRLAAGSGSTGETLDPALIEGNFMPVLQYALRNSLTEVAADGTLVGELAEQWRSNADATEWTFTLRQGVSFSDGRPFNAASAIASLNHHRGEDTASVVKVLFESITEIRADGEHTIVITLNSGNADFPLFVSDYHVLMLPLKDGKADWQSGVGTGGYVLENFEPGVRATLKKNPNYWKSDRAHFDSAEILSIADVNARTNALTTGQIDAMDRCDLKTVHLLKRNKKLRITEVTGTQHYTLPMSTTAAPFDNVDVRLALKYALDRESLVKTILRGHGQVGNDHPISSAYRYFNDQMPQRAYDPDKAQFHLKKAGLDKLDVTLSVSDAAFSGAVDAAVLYQEHARKAGIHVTVDRAASDGYWSNVWMKKPWSASFWSGRPTEDWMFSTAYSKGAAWNETFWDNTRFNELLNSARSELDTQKRQEQYFEMQQILSDQGGAIVPMFANFVNAEAVKVQHGSLASNYDFDGHRAIERWWFS